MKFLLYFSIFVLLLCLLFILFNTNQHKQIIVYPPVDAEINSPSQKNQWKIYMQNVGSENAFKYFKSVSHAISFTAGHTAIHAIGQLLYEQSGIEGLPICDNSFSFGCYHGFFGIAIQKSGLTKIKEMDEVCIKHFGFYGLGCQHGMGHGLMAYFGENNLKQALAVCDKLQWKGKIGGCRGGVFMEYNFNNITHSEIPKPRKLDSRDPYFPCNVLSKSYQYSCYYSQPEWWNTVYKKDFKKIIELCQNLKEENKNICFLGTGIVASQTTSFNTTQTLMKCNDISDPYNNMLCKAGATWIFDTSFPEIPRSLFCDSLPNTIKDTCLEKSKIIQ